jgi:phasin family protein
MANGKSGKPKNVGKVQGAGSTATAAPAVEAAKPVSAQVAAAVAKAIEAPVKKPAAPAAAKPAAIVQPAVLNQSATPELAVFEAPEPVVPQQTAPVQAKTDPAPAAPVQAAKLSPAPAPQRTPLVEALKVAPAAEAPKPAEKIQTIPTNVTQTGANIMNETINRTQEATQQVAQQATEQFRGAMNDVNQRGQVAMEKSARMVEEMADLARGNMEALVASSKTAAKYVETLTQGAADYNRRSFEQASATLRSFAEVKSPTDFFRLQSEFARTQFDSMVSEGARVSETMVKMSGDVAEPITSRVSVASERLKAVAA